MRLKQRMEQLTVCCRFLADKLVPTLHSADASHINHLKRKAENHKQLSQQERKEYGPHRLNRKEGIYQIVKSQQP